MITSETSYRLRIEKLHQENGIYFPKLLPPRETWFSQFKKHWKLRHLWQNTDEKNAKRNGLPLFQNSFRIQVCARFRPKQLEKNDVFNGKKRGKNIILPFHQRLALIQADRKVSRKEALKDIYNEGGFGFGESKEDIVGENCNQDEEQRDGVRGGVQWIDTNHSRVFVADPTKGIREFQFDIVEDGSSQHRIYQTCAAPLVSEFLNGYNTTCLVYGMTGSGKTHTMIGSDHIIDDDYNICIATTALKKQNINENKWGVIPRVCVEVFDAMEARRANQNFIIKSSMFVSYVEIYGDEVTDLLRGGVRCGQSRVAAQRFVLDGSAEVEVSSIQDIMEQLKIGELQKRKAATAMNQRSSRAHAIFLLTLDQTCEKSNKKIKSRMLMADLGGCEQLKKSQPGTGNDRDRTREAININLGLMALKKCVERLTILAANKNKEQSKPFYIPFADSKLTMLLSSGLSGNSKTSVIICGAQEEEHAAETISTMRFGEACGGVSTTASTTNISAVLQDILKQIDDQIAKCEAVIKKKERWETRTTQRPGADDVLNTFKRTVLVGAEDERQELEMLLKKRNELTRVSSN